MPPETTGWLHVGRSPGLELEPAVLAVARRDRLGQADDAALAEQIQPVVGEHQRTLADAAVRHATSPVSNFIAVRIALENP